MTKPASEECFDLFFRRDFPKLVAFLVKAGFGREGAQDAAAAAMLCAYRQWATLTNPAAWVRRAAYRIAARQARRDREGVVRAIAGGWLERFATDADHVETIDDGTVLIELLDTLPASQRLVFGWHMDGFSSAEIAQQLRMSPSTVRSTLRHARNRLKQQLETSRTFEWRRIEGGARDEHQA